MAVVVRCKRKKEVIIERRKQCGGRRLFVHMISSCNTKTAVRITQSVRSPLVALVEAVNATRTAGMLVN